jgi:hypothetical protein
MNLDSLSQKCSGTQLYSTPDPGALLEVSARFGKRLKPTTFLVYTMVPSDNVTNQKLLTAYSIHLMAVTSMGQY